MSRLADQIVASGVDVQVNPPDPRRLREEVAGGPVLVCDNVAEYYFVAAGRTMESWVPADFPLAVPAWPTVFCEFRARTQWPADRWWHGEMVDRAGVLFRTRDLWHDADAPAGEPPRDCFGRRAPATARWEIQAILITREGRSARPRACQTMAWWLDSAGRVTGPAEGDPLAGVLLSTRFMERYAGVSDMEWAALMDLNLRTILYPCLLALAFTHCKNVRRETIAPPRPLSRAHEKRHGHPLVTYTTLQIDPMREVLQRAGGGEPDGLPKALHICRGHFAHYDERPLFGKLKGTFWKPMHVRGSATDRLVIKDYAVAGPSKDGPR
jgi:hypothetical protein